MTKSDSSSRSSWKWLIGLTSIFAFGIIGLAFWFALLWSVDNIDRVESHVANYQAHSYYAVLPLDPEVIQVARVDRGELIFDDGDRPTFTPTPSIDTPSPTITSVSSVPSVTASATDEVGDTSTPNPSPSASPSQTSTLTPTPTATGLVTQIMSPTPRPTNPRPTQSEPTNTQPSASGTPGRPTATQLAPPPTQTQPPATQPPPTSPPPTQPPLPTRTRDPYPPPTAYP